MGNTARDYSNNLDQARLASPSQFHAPQAADADINYGKSGIRNHASGAADTGIEYGEKKEGNNSDRLNDARKNTVKSGSDEDIANKAKAIAETATPMGAASLLKQIEFMGDMPFAAAMGAALLKDLFDMVTFETIILPILFSTLCSIFIFMMLLLVGSSGKRKSVNALLKKMGFLVAGGVADSIPGIDFFPIESITVAIIYLLTLIERRDA